MNAYLEIEDGAVAWWESPDIWVVPGSDPLGQAGTPISGQSAYLWARVHNRGESDVASARVDYWWSNPSVGVTRTLSTLVGSAFVDVPAGGSEEALCVAPWFPSFINDGHECLVCEVVSTADPLPTPPPDEFNPTQHHQIAQRNLSVLELQPIVLGFQMAMDPRSPGRRLELQTELGGELDQQALATLGLAEWRPAKEPLVTAGLAMSANCGAESSSELVVPTETGHTTGAYLHIRPAAAADESRRRTYTLVRVTEHRSSSKPGITYVVRGGRNE
jgi:hypothetical protein